MREIRICEFCSIIRIIVIFFTVWVLSLLAGTAAICADALQLETIGEIEEVFVWKRDKCGPNDIPDSPARAIRLSDGTIVFIAAHYTNRVSVGRSFQSLRRQCGTRSEGQSDPEPSKFDDRYWVQAIFPLPDDGVYALVSHEYMGRRHEGKCEIPQQGHYPTCWYSSILAATAPAHTKRFDLLALDKRVVAASASKYNPSRRERLGFLAVSNIVRHQGYLYTFIYSELLTQRGNCLFRTPEDQPLGPWLALSGGSFKQAFPSAYYDKSPAVRRCDIIGEGAFHGSIKSVVWLSGVRKWMAVTMRTVKAGPNRADQSGVFYSLSDDLMQWSPGKRLFTGMQPWGQNDCTIFYTYPSVIDHQSASNIFDTVDTDDVYLYLTRFNYQNCVKGLNRDLVRLRIRLPRP
ncbi:MAG: hypothetical protein HC900_06340 [Methylacidiphilales bacterium]|nr:hypothetical protein [Candidatus Methylacidiphilales bacterium]